MCVIICCKPNCRPSADVLEAAFWRNPDGAGVMWADGHEVHGRKGLMTLEALEDAVADVDESAPLVIHCRIGTSGGNGPEVTHPYPVSYSLERLHALEWAAPVGIAHNGMLPYPTDDERGVSDTVSYVKREAWPLKLRTRGRLATDELARAELARTSTGSRLAVMDGRGHVARTGRGWEKVARGIVASNGSWRPLKSYGDLPRMCAGCDMCGRCAIYCPLCEDVALALGYTPEDVADELTSCEGW